MASAIEKAYLLLLGQIALIASAIAFGVPFYWYSQAPGVVQLPDRVTIFFIAFTLTISLMMIINIIIGWAALVQLIDGKNKYNPKMFVLDLIIVVVLFCMNNVIMFAFGESLSLKSVDFLQTIVTTGIRLETTAIMASALFLLTGLFLFLCKFWNYEFYKQIGLDIVHTRYEKTLWVVIVASLVSAVVTFLFKSIFWVQVTCSIVLVVFWIYVNGYWVLSNFIQSTDNQADS